MRTVSRQIVQLNRRDVVCVHTEDLAQPAVECLPCREKALGSSPSACKRKLKQVAERWWIALVRRSSVINTKP